MSPDQLGTALRDLVDGVEDDALAPAPGDALARRQPPPGAHPCGHRPRRGLGRRDGRPRRLARRRAARLRPGAAGRRPRARPPDLLPGRHRQAALPRRDRPSRRHRRGGHASTATRSSSTPCRRAGPSPASRSRTSLRAPGTPALSPDGRWLARGAVLNDLTTGQTLSFDSPRAGEPEVGLPTDGAVWWAPDSRRAYVAGFGQGSPPSSMGVVLGVDGGVTEVPLLLGGVVAVDAGWIDDETLVALAGLRSARRAARDPHVAGR